MMFAIATTFAGGVSSGAHFATALVKALLLTLLVVGAVLLAVVAWPIISQALITLPLIALFSFITYPRRKGVR